jgi:hypothetical protein
LWKFIPYAIMKKNKFNNDKRDLGEW